MSFFTKVLFFLVIFFSDLTALVASDIDASNALIDISLVVSMAVSILMLLMGYKKTMSILGK